MTVASLQELLEAGVHFGHQSHRWNPKMKPYIWGERNGIYIIDLTKTSKLLDEAYDFMKQAAARGKKIVFVGTKKQAAHIVKEEAERCNSYFINRRWLGGTLTNFETIRTRIRPWQADEREVAAFTRWVRDPDKMKYISDGEPWSDAGITAFFERQQASLRSSGVCFGVVEWQGH